MVAVMGMMVVVFIGGIMMVVMGVMSVRTFTMAMMMAMTAARRIAVFFVMYMVSVAVHP
ncbi:MAG: hypothetical protein J5492_02960 [Oxalobacter sp.]|nr:hypothetical protein [Oxalobacter sp.]